MLPASIHPTVHALFPNASLPEAVVAELQVGAATIGGLELLPACVVLVVLTAVGVALCLTAARRHDEAELRRRIAQPQAVRAVRPGAVAVPPDRPSRPSDAP